MRCLPWRWLHEQILIVSGDQDLLVLQRFKGIPLVTAAQALESITPAQ